MTDNKPLTIEEQLKELKIENSGFETFYIALSNTKSLPSPETIPVVSSEQYTLIISYLTNEGVLDAEKKVNLETLDLFVRKKSIEDILKIDTHYRGRDYEPTGGLLPCRSYNSGSTGGLAPCRDDY